MPTYEYECPTCGTYDVEQRITAAALASCGSCGAPVRRLISRTSFALKGGGWYSDGYGAGASKKAEAKSEGSSGGGCGKPECGTGACAGASALQN